MAWSSLHLHHTLGENDDAVTALQSGGRVLAGAGVTERKVLVGVAVVMGASSVSSVARSVNEVRV